VGSFTEPGDELTVLDEEFRMDAEAPLGICEKATLLSGALLVTLTGNFLWGSSEWEWPSFGTVECRWHERCGAKRE
jgi:uncharacterized protein YodC (DUF2158 family)